MGWKNREIELKLLVTSKVTYQTVVAALNLLLGKRCKRIIKGESKDVYFTAPRRSRADFVRVRYGTDDETSQITLKYSDKRSNTNRVEVDVAISDPAQAERLLGFCLGRPAGEIRKRYMVYFFTDHDNVSVYQIKNDSRVFIEIEATTLRKVQKMLRSLRMSLPYGMVRVRRSLFQLFVAPKRRGAKKAA